MSGQPTRALRGWLPREWRRFGGFLRNPVLPPRAELSLGGTLRALPPLFALDVLLMALVLGAIGLASSAGLKMPNHLLEGFKLTPLLVAAIVVGAPIAEEALFRGWVSGRPGHVLATVAIVAGLAGVVAWKGSLLAAGGVVAAVALAILAIYAFRKRDSMGWFARHFRWFFYASAVLFALVHLTNFASAGAAAVFLVPLVIPQFTLALLLAYLRVERGLWSSMLLHITHNALFIGMMLIGSSAA